MTRNPSNPHLAEFAYAARDMSFDINERKEYPLDFFKKVKNRRVLVGQATINVYCQTWRLSFFKEVRLI
jgi:hypothetical protein